MSPPSPVLLALRQSTAAAHRRIESVLPLSALADRQRLRHVLAALAGFHEQWEPAALRLLPAADAAWLHARSRCAWLQQDLAALAAGQPPVADQPGPPLQLVDAAAAWGSVYVMEGSTLGGQVIAHHLRDTLGLHADNGARYYAGHGARTASLWRDCLQRLDTALGDDPAALQRACSAAAGVFEQLTQRLQVALHQARLSSPPPSAPTAPHGSAHALA